MAEPVDTSKPAPNLDADKVKQFQKGFYGGDGKPNPTIDAIKRRMSALMAGDNSS